ncbi:MAG: RnfABCDGE type electron transport complex subunit D [Coriobacteriia bacterium]
MSHDSSTRLVVASSPHIAAKESSRAIMLWVVAALAPSAIWALWNMKGPAAITLTSCIVAAVGSEFLWNVALRKPQSAFDGSALLTGLLLAMTLPPRTPWWMCVAGAVVAIIVAKMLFGGLGFNLFNPALVGRAFVTVSWAGVLAQQVNKGWFETLSLPGSETLDAVTGATRLGLAAADRAAQGAYGYDLAQQYGPLLWHNLEGSLGEISAGLLIAGGLLLIAKGIIDWRIPASYVGAMVLLTWAFGSDPVFNVLAGGVLLGAFFMATDYVTSPMTKWGRVVFGLGCGVLNAVGRFYGSMPETTTFAILFMNGFAPLIDRWFRPRTFGWSKKDA